MSCKVFHAETDKLDTGTDTKAEPMEVDETDSILNEKLVF